MKSDKSALVSGVTPDTTKKLFIATGLLLCACAGPLNIKASHEAFAKEFSNQKEIWKREVPAIQNAGYLLHISLRSQREKMNGNLEIYYLSPDTAILLSPGFLDRGPLRGQWVLGKKLLIYFRRENRYYEGGWEGFLFGRKKETAGLDSLIFGILSRKGLLPGPTSDSVGPAFSPKKGGGWKKKGWGWVQYFDKWERYHRLNARDRLTTVFWYSRPREVEVEVEIDKRHYNQLSPKRVKWLYRAENVSASIRVERAVVNVVIPEAKTKFQVPPDAVQLEK